MGKYSIGDRDVDLSVCPVCGGEAIPHSFRVGFGIFAKHGYMEIQCSMCHFGVQGISIPHAVKVWEIVCAALKDEDVVRMSPLEYSEGDFDLHLGDARNFVTGWQNTTGVKP